MESSYKNLRMVLFLMAFTLSFVSIFGIVLRFLIVAPRVIAQNTSHSKICIFEVTKPEPEVRVIVIQPEEQEEEPMTERELIRSYIYNICTDYPNVDPAIIEAQVWEESRYISDVVGGGGAWIGLLQIAPRWHRDRMARLGVNDLFDPYDNILVGVDYMSELIDTYGDISLALMLYNGSSNAYSKWKGGQLSVYARSVIDNADILRNGGELP